MRTIKEIKADIKISEQAMLNSNYQNWARDYWNTLLEHYKGELRLALTADIPLDRLEEICTAERDRRCKVLPCKVGDEIFSFRWSIKHQKYEVCARKAKNIRYDAADDSVMVSDGDRYCVWGKTVFPTPEEARAALKEGNK